MIVSEPISRYEGALVVQAPDEEGVYHPTLYARVFSTSYPRFEWYTFRPGDRLDLLASNVFGDPTMWWWITDINPEYFDPDDIVAGSVIRIPVR